ncbi:MAG: hypothetical protein GY816_11555, partial [Cytophagales bacterium]|nr:hypothetical protein [Cytophagales bacterium]
CPMGAINSGPHFQRVMQTALEEVLYECVLQYIDDTLVYTCSDKVEEHLKNLDKYFNALHRKNIKLHPSKATFFATELVWGGRLLNQQGVGIDPARAKALSTISTPSTVGQLMEFVYAAGWCRSNIPCFAEIADPLYKIIQKALASKARRTKKAGNKIELDSCDTWIGKGQTAFENLKKSLANSVITNYHDPEKQISVFADASDNFWAMIITQCDLESFDKP